MCKSLELKKGLYRILEIFDIWPCMRDNQKEKHGEANAFTAYLTRATVAALTRLWTPYYTPDMPLFCLCVRQISQRKRAAGRWKSPCVPVIYARKARAGQNAVARLLGSPSLSAKQH